MSNYSSATASELTTSTSQETKKRCRVESPNEEELLPAPNPKLAPLNENDGKLESIPVMKNSWECSSIEEFKAQPLPGWTTTTFPKPNEGSVLISYCENQIYSRYLIPIDKVDDKTWALLISMDGIEFWQQLYYWFDHPECWHAEAMTAAEYSRWESMKASGLFHDPNDLSESFQRYKQYKLPSYHSHQAMPNQDKLKLSQITAVIQTGFFYEVEL
jgi:hypothetical protein